MVAAAIVYCPPPVAADTHECSANMDGRFHVCFYYVSTWHLFLKVYKTFCTSLIIDPYSLTINEKNAKICILMTGKFMILIFRFVFTGSF